VAMGVLVEEAVRRFAAARFDALVAALVGQLKEMPASGIYSDICNFRTVWDEYCYGIQEGPHDSQYEILGGPHDIFAATWDPTLETMITTALDAIPDPEAVLLTVVAQWRIEEDEGPCGPLAADCELLCRTVRGIIDTLAMDRNMSEIEHGDEDSSNAWQLTDDDRWLLGELRNAVRRLAVIAPTGNDLIAVGEVWQALDAILDDEPVEVNVELSLDFRRGDEASYVGTDLSLRVNDEEVRLNELTTTWDTQVGTDHSSLDHAVLTPTGGFDTYDVGEWLERFVARTTRDDAILSTSRDHV
jgi:hypothetical protein